MCVTLQVNRKNKVKSGESSDESEGETVTETQQVSYIIYISVLDILYKAWNRLVPLEPQHFISTWNWFMVYMEITKPTSKLCLHVQT